MKLRGTSIYGSSLVLGQTDFNMHTEAERLEGCPRKDQQGWRATGNQKRQGRILPYRFQRDTTAIGHPDFRLQTSELWDSTVLML